MPEETTATSHKARLPGFDPEATPLIGIGLGLTGLALGLRPRLAAWPLALTAVAALIYRDPERVTPDLPGVVYSPADGTVVGIDEFYEHRFLHTDAVRLSIAVAPFEVPVQRSPVSGEVIYLEHTPGSYRPIWDVRSSEQNERQYIGLKAEWGPVLLTLVAGPLARRIQTRISLGEHVEAGARLSTVRLGTRVDLVLPADIVQGLPVVGERLQAGTSRIGQVR